MKRFMFYPFGRPGCVYYTQRGYAYPQAEAVDKTAWFFEECPLGHREQLPRPVPYKVVVQAPMRKGQRVMDARGGITPLFVDRYLLDKLEEMGATGYLPVPVEVKGFKHKKPNDQRILPELFEIRIKSMSTMDRPASGYVVTSDPCPQCGSQSFTKESDGIVLAEDSGTDFTSVAEWRERHIFSERITNLFVEEEVKPLAIFRAEDLPFSASISREQTLENDVLRLVRQGFSRGDATAEVQRFWSVANP